MTYAEYTSLFKLTKYGARLIRACEIAMRLPKGVFAREDLLDTMKERRDQLFAEILADELIQSQLKNDPMTLVNELNATQNALDVRRADIAKQLREAREAGASPLELAELAKQLNAAFVMA